MMSDRALRELKQLGKVKTDKIARVLDQGKTDDGRVFVASPMYKQRFDLTTGRCLDVDGMSVAVHDVRVVDGRVEVALREPSVPGGSTT